VISALYYAVYLSIHYQYVYVLSLQSPMVLVDLTVERKHNGWLEWLKHFSKRMVWIFTLFVAN